MDERKLDCCVARDLLPSYLEDLTEPETTREVEAHLEGCEACRKLAEDMRRDIPVEKAPKRTLDFLKKVKRTRLLAAALSLLLALWAALWLYGREFAYPNTEAGRLAAVCDYIVEPEDSWNPTVAAGTETRVIAWTEKDDRLLIAFRAENEEHVWGYLYLARGFNGRYQIRSASYGPSQYTGGVYAAACRPEDKKKDPGWDLYLLIGDNCRDIYTAELTFEGTDFKAEQAYTRTKTYELDGENFLWTLDREAMSRELGFPHPESTRVYCTDVRYFDRDGEDITSRYFDPLASQSWAAGKGTAELFLLYVYMAVVIGLGVIFARYFLLPDKPAGERRTAEEKNSPPDLPEHEN